MVVVGGALEEARRRSFGGDWASVAVLAPSSLKRPSRSFLASALRLLSPEASDVASTAKLETPFRSSAVAAPKLSSNHFAALCTTAASLSGYLLRNASEQLATSESWAASASIARSGTKRASCRRRIIVE